MDKNDINVLIKQGMSQRQIADKMGCSQSTVRYWLQKHNMRTLKISKHTYASADGDTPSTKTRNIPKVPATGVDNSSYVGSITESQVLAALTKYGFPCYIPFGVGKADLIIETFDGFRTIQCKTARLSKDGKSLIFRSCTIDRKGKRHSYKGLIDYFAVTSSEVPGVFLIPVKDAPESDMSLRLEGTSNGQTKGVNYAHEYAL